MRWTLKPTDEALVQELQTQLQIHPIFCQLLIQRNIQTFEDAKDFFRPEWSNLHDPFLMKNMDLAIDRLEKAIKNNERILLYGDYDVDGTTAVALMHSFLEPLHSNLDYYIPDRYKEGYGVSMASIDYAKQNGVSLIIAMDCGIKAIQPVAQAKSQNIDFIICDHHLPGPQLPDALAILDPKQKDCPYPFKELSGCGVAFKLAQAYLKKNKKSDNILKDLSDFLVISIASDLVPMIGENRILSYWGLKKLNETLRPGLIALIEESRRTAPLSINDIVFGLGPMINAAGRLADAQAAVRLMLAKDKMVAAEHARILQQRNELRKEHDKLIAEEAKKMFQEIPNWESKKSIVLYQSHWHKGIVGIAAARMVDKFHRPAIMLTQSNGKIVGSARSIKGFNVYKAIQKCEHLLENFGGHHFAAGLTLLEKNLEAFKTLFEEEVRNHITPEQTEPEIEISAILELQDIQASFWKILKQFAPFGPGNRSPIFATKNVKDIGYSKALRGDHLRLAVKQGDSKPVYGIAFGKGADIEKVSTGEPFHLCYKLENNKWKEQENLQLVVKDIKF